MIVQRVRQRAHPSLVSFRGCINQPTGFLFLKSRGEKRFYLNASLSLSFVLRAVKRLSCAHREDDDGDDDDGNDDAFSSRAKFDVVVSALFYAETDDECLFFCSKQKRNDGKS